MGNLGGHLIPGTFFFLFGIWWGFITSIRFLELKLRSSIKKKPQYAYKSTVAMPCVCCPCERIKTAPIESYLKIVLPTIAALIELYTGIYHGSYVVKKSVVDNSQPNNVTEISEVVNYTGFQKGNLQHITMYSAFIFGAIIEVLMHYGVSLPDKLEHVCGLFAFSIEAFLFANHLHGKEPVEVHVHVLLVYAIVCCAIFTALEIYNSSQILFTYGRILFTILQGTWFWHVGFLLYPPFKSAYFVWDLNDHSSIMTITVSFCWHVILIFILLLLQYFVVSKLCFRSNQYFFEYDELLVICENKDERKVTDNDSEQIKKFAQIDSDDEFV